jgi:hypothetical protein
MTEESDKPERIQLSKGHRWPKDRHGDEIDIGDFLMFVHWAGYPTASVGKVTRIGKTGKVHVRVVKIHTKDREDDVEIKECKSTTKLSKNVISALTVDKLARA